MASILARHTTHDGSRRNPYTARPLRDHRCHDCRVSNPTRTPSTSFGREGCPHNRGFAATRKRNHRNAGSSVDSSKANRFSILADLDYSSTQSKWSFDFVQSSNSATRRRGKRGGKHNKTKSAAQRERMGRKSDSMGGLCEKVAALCLEDELPPPAHLGTGLDRPIRVPTSDFTFSVDTVRHNWVPKAHTGIDLSTTGQVGPNRQEASSFLQSPSRCLTKGERATAPTPITASRRQESRFFPLSAFLASPPSAAHGTATGNLLQPALTQQKPTSSRPSSASPTLTEQASALPTERNLSSRSEAIDTRSTLPLVLQRSPKSCPSPLALAEALDTASRVLSPEQPLVTTSLSAPLPITPPHAATPTLTTSPATSSIPLQAPPIDLFSKLSSLKLTDLPSLPSVPQEWPLLQDSTSPQTLITTPVTSPQQFIVPALRDTAICPTTRFSVSESVKPVEPKLLPLDVSVFNTGAQKGLDTFLKMGHANPCWCTSHSSPKRDSFKPKVEHPHQNKLDIAIRPPKRKYDELDLGSDIDDLFLSPSSASSESGFEYVGIDEIANSIHHADDADWTVVSSSCDTYSGPQTPATNTVDIMSDFDTLSSSASIISLLSPPITPIVLPITPPVSEPCAIQLPSDFQLAEDKTDHPMPPCLLSPWSTPPQSSSKPYKCPDCDRWKCACAIADTSAVEWPSLREAMNVRRTRRGSIYKTDESTESKAWDGVTDWSI